MPLHDLDTEPAWGMDCSPTEDSEQERHGLDDPNRSNPGPQTA